ncbi:MAG: aminotransferase class III-fold pyridoxal phosphate-dependent enzyme, partial [Gemmataceae bacterium]
HDMIFILDEVQANFGRCGPLFAFTKYGLEPDLVVLGKGLGNGVPVAAVVGRADVLGALQYGDASDTWSANPLNAAAVLATLDEFEQTDVLQKLPALSQQLEAGLVRLKEFAPVNAVRGECGGMVWGVEFHTPESANAFVLQSYRAGVHLLGPLAKKVVRISPPLTITPAEVDDALKAFRQALEQL